MGNMVNLIEEIRTRIVTAKASGVLTNIKYVLIGDTFGARKPIDFPVIYVYPTSGYTTDIYRRTGNSDTINLTIQLIERALSNESITLYKTSDQTGFLYTLEDLLNVLDKTTAGTQDLTFNNTAYRLKQISWDIVTEDNLINCKINLEISTSLFQIGGR